MTEEYEKELGTIWDRWLLTFVVFTDFLGIGIAITVFAPLFLQSQHSYTTQLMLLGITISLYPLGQFLGATNLGKLSDHRGRKPLLVMTIAATCVGRALTALSINFSSIGLLFFSRFFTGVAAGNFTIARSSMADLSTKKSKMANMSLLQTGTGLAVIIGPFFGGLLTNPRLVSWFGYSTPFWFLAAFTALFLIFVIFQFRETLKEPHHEKASIFSGFLYVAEAFSTPTLRRIFSVCLVFYLGWSYFIQYLGAYLVTAFKFSSTQIGYVMASIGAVYVASQVLIVRPLSKRFKTTHLVMVSMLLQGILVTILSTISVVSVFWLCISLYGLFSAVTSSALPTLVSNSAPVKQQGHVLGMLASILAISIFATGLLGGYLLTFNPAMSFFVGGGFMLISWLILSIFLRRHE